MVKDPVLVKNILSRDFDCFANNDFLLDVRQDPLLSHDPFLVTGERWKRSRSLLTPSFTGAKIKQLFPVMESVADAFVTFIGRHVAQELEAKEVSLWRLDKLIGSLGCILIFFWSLRIIVHCEDSCPVYHAECRCVYVQHRWRLLWGAGERVSAHGKARVRNVTHGHGEDDDGRVSSNGGEVHPSAVSGLQLEDIEGTLFKLSYLCIVSSAFC